MSDFYSDCHASFISVNIFLLEMTKDLSLVNAPVRAKRVKIWFVTIRTKHFV